MLICVVIMCLFLFHTLYTSWGSSRKITVLLFGIGVRSVYIIPLGTPPLGGVYWACLVNVVIMCANISNKVKNDDVSPHVSSKLSLPPIHRNNCNMIWGRCHVCRLTISNNLVMSLSGVLIYQIR